MKVDMLREKWDRLPKEKILELQSQKLRQHLQEVILPFSKHYRQLFKEHNIDVKKIRSIEDLQSIPFSSKKDLSPTVGRPDKPRDFIITPDKAVLKKRPQVIARALLKGRSRLEKELEHEFRPILMTSTTGRSAEPIPFVYTKHDVDNLALAGKRIMELCGGKPEYKMLNMFPYAPHLAFWQTHYAGTEFGIFVFSSGGGKVMGTTGNLRVLSKINPEVLIGIPTFVYHVLHQAVEEGLRCENLQKIVLGGEKVEDGMRAKMRLLASQLGATKEVDVLATYGFTEAKMAFVECPYPSGEKASGYHLYPDMGLVEVIDPDTEEVLPEGVKGEIVYTPLDARGTTILRYRTGDIIENGMVYEPCPFSGRMAPRLVGRISRRSEIKEMKLDKIKGTLVDFNHLEYVMESADHVGAWQLEIRKIHDDPMEIDELILHVEKSDRTSDDTLRKGLKDHFSSLTEIQPNAIYFHNTQEMQRLHGVGVQIKEQKIVDHRPGSKQFVERPQEIITVNTNGGFLKRTIRNVFPHLMKTIDAIGHKHGDKEKTNGHR
ncbi:MAG: AMP-binding protein [Verrucomicrobiota bacterium]